MEGMKENTNQKRVVVVTEHIFKLKSQHQHQVAVCTIEDKKEPIVGGLIEYRQKFDSKLNLLFTLKNHLERIFSKQGF